MDERKLNPAGSGAWLRCFVALPLARASADHLLTAWHAAQVPGWRRDVRVLPAVNLHLTLLFLGRVECALAPELIAAVGCLDGHGTRASATAFVGLPRRDHATVAAAELAPDPRWLAWRDALVARLAESVGADTRALRPHVTVARRRRGCALPRQPLDRPVTLLLGAPRLLRSETGPSGARYFPLMPDGPPA